MVAGRKGVADFRRILDDQSVDAVTIATPDHWHVPVALLALAAGKHVYVEKPCSHNVREGQLLVAAAKKTRQSRCARHAVAFQPVDAAGDEAAPRRRDRRRAASPSAGTGSCARTSAT